MRAGALPVPSVLVDGSSVTRGKPHPEGYLLAAELLEVAPADCLVVEDAPAADLAAADLVVGSLFEATPELGAWTSTVGR